MPQTKRIAVLFSRLSGYMLACLKTLKTQHDVELLVFHLKPASEAPFDLAQFDWITHRYLREEHDESAIERIVRDFGPQAIYMAGWKDSGYVKVARSLKKDGIPVISGLDGQWAGSPRQRLGALAAPFALHPSIDVLWVCGERQAQFAHRLGYSGAKCWHGVYCCDWDKFARTGDATANEAENRSFLYVGRYVPVKGIDCLLEAYRLYRSRVERPWQLTCAGAGQLKHLLQEDGVVDAGFQQPEALPSLMHKATAFILPSRFEPWGVVLQEAATSGLPLICSDACGAAVHLLQDGYNGYLFESENVEHLADCMTRMALLEAVALQEMGQRSYELSKQFTPQRWAVTFMHGLESLSRKQQGKLS